MLSSDSEMVCVDNADDSVKKEPIKPCTIRLLRDRDIDQRLRKKCKKNEAGFFYNLIPSMTSLVMYSKNKTSLQPFLMIRLILKYR